MSKRDYSKIFKKNYLTSVAFEMRFVPLFIIKQHVIDFQRQIREEFPFSPREPFLPSFEPEKWIFNSKEGKNQIKLTDERFGFNTKEYNSFEPFFENIKKKKDLFLKIVKEDIENVSRIGIRYINEIPLEGENPIDEILEWFEPKIDKNNLNNNTVINFFTEIRSEYNRNGLTCSNQFYQRKTDNSYWYVIDIDSYTEKTIKKENIENLIKELHSIAIKEFHENVTDQFLKTLDM